MSRGAYFIMEQSGHDLVLRARVDGRLLGFGYALLAILLVVRWLRRR